MASFFDSVLHSPFGPWSTFSSDLTIWKEIQIWWKGKSLAVLGARGVGKTQLQEFLTTGSIPKITAQTIKPETTKKTKRKLCKPQERGQGGPDGSPLGALELVLKEGRDVSGSDSAYGDWKKLVKNAHIILYLVRADHILEQNSEAVSRARADMKHISTWMKKMESRKPKLFIVGTHCDIDPAYVALTPGHFGDYNDRFSKLPIVKDLVLLGGGSSQVEVVLGSMRDDHGAEELTYSIFQQALQSI